MGLGRKEDRIDPVADLASCVAACLMTLGEHEPGCAQHLNQALMRLLSLSGVSRPAVVHLVSERPAVEPFLSFLLPEIDRASPLAGEAVRQAIEVLRKPTRARFTTMPHRFLH